MLEAIIIFPTFALVVGIALAMAFDEKKENSK